ncbi:MAG: flavin reductase family protein [Acidobacteria bacterium]|nr:flavin reductase family protein [Acidobacteriota bacterium]
MSQMISAPGLPTVDIEAFKGAMGAVATPVSVVTAYAGAAHGTTVSAFMSLSLEPTMVLISLHETSDLLEILHQSRRFGLNVLAHDQGGIGAQFARRGVDRWDGVEWDLQHEVPRLAGTASFVACSISQLITAGDHAILTGVVDYAENSERPGLVYQHRRFGTFMAN